MDKETTQANTMELILDTLSFLVESMHKIDTEIKAQTHQILSLLEKIKQDDATDLQKQ